MKDKLKMAVVGLGHRGMSLMRDVLIKQPDVEVVGISDLYEERVQEGVKIVKDATGKEPISSLDYIEMLEKAKPDAVLVSTYWETHVDVALYALEHNIAVAMEVGGAYTIDELWRLVKTQERTSTPFMFMENCCYDRAETLATNMARAGVFGKIVHLDGAYGHDLREEITTGIEEKHYRLRNYLNRNCENYPTHEIGPIAKLIDVNRGNRFISLVSMASKAAGLSDYVAEHADRFPHLVGKQFKQGDIVDTIITCANGETIHIRLDTTLPRFYARNFTVRGTKGFYEQNTNLVFVDGDEEGFDPVVQYKAKIDNGKNYEEKYLPDFWKNVTPEQLASGHGGMDYFEFRVFIDCIKKGEEPPIDVYDAATWMAITVLSEQSIALGGAPVAFPDFTEGKWLIREHKEAF
ncbi:MAG: Gfo/Idh/MocA family oxidoreductase [Clostridia bacterium]|nr:Gfo/Idh/MocA family oxidoreductase [Clostridia bacterium]